MTNYTVIAEQFGIEGFCVESWDDYEETLAAAVASDGPSVVDQPVRLLPSIEDVLVN